MPLAGYFYDATEDVSMLLDGSPSVMLGYAVPATLIDFRESTASPVTKGPNLFRQGGTVQTLAVKGAFIRELPKGDGEWWAYTLLAWLGGTWLGELAINSQAYTDTMFTNGSVSLVAGMHDSGPTNTCHIEYSLNFMRSVPASTALPAPSFSAIAQPTYNGRTNNADYAAGSRPLGANGSRSGHAEISSRLCRP